MPLTLVERALAAITPWFAVDAKNKQAMSMLSAELRNNAGNPDAVRSIADALDSDDLLAAIHAAPTEQPPAEEAKPVEAPQAEVTATTENPPAA